MRIHINIFLIVFSNRPFAGILTGRDRCDCVLFIDQSRMYTIIDLFHVQMQHLVNIECVLQFVNIVLQTALVSPDELLPRRAVTER